MKRIEFAQDTPCCEAWGWSDATREESWAFFIDGEAGGERGETRLRRRVKETIGSAIKGERR